jgi:hypothetical protein
MRWKDKGKTRERTRRWERKRERGEEEEWEKRRTDQTTNLRSIPLNLRILLRQTRKLRSFLGDVKNVREDVDVVDSVRVGGVEGGEEGGGFVEFCKRRGRSVSRER